MPELAEVERARSLLAEVALNKTIKSVRVTEDTIVFVGDAQTEFVSSLVGRKVLEVSRLGKQFYMIFDGPGPKPLFHLGMSGSCGIKDGDSMVYRKKPKKALNENGEAWPPRYWKACLTFDDDTEWAYTDSRRLGRIKLIDAEDIFSVPPLSLLGMDPYLNMPTVEHVQTKLAARTAPIKAILLDQNAIFAGLGNWLVDEILYHAKIHPAQPCNSLSAEQVAEICKQITYVIGTAVSAQADSALFPAHWLFKSRWGKGRGGKGKQPTFIMENGETTPIVFETVGGRTSAICTAVQILDKSTIPVKSPKKKKVTTTTTVEVEEETVEGGSVSSKKVKRKRKTVVKKEAAEYSDSDLTPLEDDEQTEIKSEPKRRRIKAES